MGKKKIKLSKISALHYVKLVFRSALLLVATALYIVSRLKNTGESFAGFEDSYWVLGIIWLVFFVEMVLRFFPSSTESMGCQKQFKKNYKPTGKVTPKLQSWKRTFAVAAAWILLNGIIGVLYYTHVIDEGILVLIALAYSVCDMICILFFCPFQTWFMKNKCCTACRIYNWDYPMMCTPLVFIPNPFALSLFACSLVLLIRWEITLRRYPQRFSEETNACLSCANCKEKLCHHKRQLRHFLKTNKDQLHLKGNTLLETVKERKKKKK